MIEYLAKALLLSSFFDLLEDLNSSEREGGLITKDEAAKLKRRYQYQCELTDSFEMLLKDFKISVDKFLPIKLVEELVSLCNKEWSGKFTVEELYEIDEREVSRLIQGFTGDGVTATDDPNIDDLFIEKGITKPSIHRESPYYEAEELMDAVSEAMPQAYRTKPFGSKN